MTTPILFVAGFGRCGTTMMMTMLDRGGFPCAGQRPAYEVDQMNPVNGIDKVWLRQQAGRAVKWIDPTVARIYRNDLPKPPVIINMTRDSEQIARSQVKMAKELLGFPGGRKAIRLLRKSLDADRPKLDAILNGLGTVYSFTFDFVLREPKQAADKLSAIIRNEYNGFGFNAIAAASVPIFRSSECAPDLSIEMRL